MKALVMERFGAALDLREVPDPHCPADGVIVAGGAVATSIPETWPSKVIASIC